MQLAHTINQVKGQKLFRDLLIVLSTSALFSLAAWIAIRLPFSPVPVSFTAQLILLSSVFLGKRGAYATWIYLAQGAMGLPVFSNGGCGLTYMLGPTGGYLIGFAIASFVVAILTEQLREKSPSKVFLILMFGNALIYVFGLPHLAILVGTENALKFGLYPFIATDILKLLLVNRSLKALKFFN